VIITTLLFEHIVLLLGIHTLSVISLSYEQFILGTCISTFWSCVYSMYVYYLYLQCNEYVV